MTSHSSNEYNREWRAKNRERARATYRAWYQKNKAKVIAKVTKYNSENKEEREEYRRKYYLDNRETLYEKDTTACERQKKFYRNNAAKVLKRAKLARSKGDGLAHRRAQSAVAYAIASGKLKRKPCEVCGETPSEGHHDSYDEDKWLSVRWLCSKHHGLCHRSLSSSSNLEGTKGE